MTLVVHRGYRRRWKLPPARRLHRPPHAFHYVYVLLALQRYHRLALAVACGRSLLLPLAPIRAADPDAPDLALPTSLGEAGRERVVNVYRPHSKCSKW